jgi:hypothetical protein
MYNVPGRIGAGYFGEPGPPRNDDVIRPGDHVRALEGRNPWMAQTGIVRELKWRGRALVLWTSEDETTVPVGTLSKIPQGSTR